MLLSSVVNPAQGFALYAGAGAYVSSVHVVGACEVTREHIYFGGLSIAAKFGRADAVRLCRRVRLAGGRVWLVRHPDGALS